MQEYPRPWVWKQCPLFMRNWLHFSLSIFLLPTLQFLALSRTLNVMKWEKLQFAVKNLSVKLSREFQSWNYLHAVTSHRSQTQSVEMFKKELPFSMILLMSSWFRWSNGGPLLRKTSCSWISSNKKTNIGKAIELWGLFTTFFAQKFCH